MRDNISLDRLSLSVGWTSCTAQTTVLQDSGSEDFKTVATSGALYLLDLPVQTFGISSGVAMDEVVENGVSVLLNCQSEGHKSIKDFWRDLVQPGEIELKGFLFCLGLVDVVKRLLEPIGDFQPGEVFQPGFKDQRLTFIQIMRAFEQQEPIMHHSSSLLVRETLTNVFTNGFQASREQFKHVKFVYNQLDMRQNLVNCVMIASPHIRTHDGNMLFCAIGQMLQVADDRWFVPIPEQVNNLMVLNISDNAAVLIEQIQFINSDTCAVDGTDLCVFVGFLKDTANRSFIQSCIIGDAGECPFDRLLSNVEDQAFGHHMVFVHVVKRFKEGFVTRAATIALPHNYDACSLPSDGDIHEQLVLDFMSVETGASTMRAAQRNRILLGGDLVAVCALLNGQDIPVFPTQNVQRPLSKLKVLPKSFFKMAVFPVAREGRLRCYSTWFAGFCMFYVAARFHALCRIAG